MTFLLLVAAILTARLHLLPRHPGIVSRTTDWKTFVDNNEVFRNFGDIKLYLVIALPMVALILLVSLLQAQHWVLLEYVFYFLVLVICFDPADLRVGIDSYLEDLKREDLQAAFHDAEGVEAFGGEFSADSWSELHAKTLSAICMRYFECYFPVIFWFGVMGLPGALAYRVVQILSRLPADQDRERSLRVKYLIDWLPVRFFALALAVVGNFAPVVDQLRKTWLDVTARTGDLLSAFISAAIHGKSSRTLADSPTGEILELEELPHLIDRTLVIWLAAIGLMTVM